MRKFKFLLAVLIILAASISQAHAQTALYKGSREIGIVKSFESSGIEYVSLEDVAALMNFRGVIFFSNDANRRRLIATCRIIAAVIATPKISCKTFGR